MLVISDTMNGRDNNYNLLRFIAACLIAYYHCYFMTLGPLMTDEGHPYLYQASQIVLSFFFIASGFLIAQSFQRQNDLLSYIMARGLRLIPGVFVLSLILAFVVGPLVSEVPLSQYFSDLRTWLYVPVTTLLEPDATLPGVFASNPNPYEIDTALWTLRYEVICYLGLALLGLAGGLVFNRIFMFASLGLVLGYGVITYLTTFRNIIFLEHFLHFGMSFYIGTVFYVLRGMIPLNLPIAAGLLALAFGFGWLIGYAPAEPIILVASAYCFFWLAYVPGGWLRAYNKLGDYSYGVYIYHYPVQQVMMHLIGGFSVAGLFLASMPFVLVLAICSWSWVERPSLSKLSQLTSRVKSLPVSLSSRL